MAERDFNRGNQATQERRDAETQEALQAGNELFEYLHRYVKEQPEAAAMWCFGIGFVLGWKLKPW